jgi:hypothetical protein
LLPAFLSLWDEIAAENHSLSYRERRGNTTKSSPSEARRDEKQRNPEQERQAKLKEKAQNKGDGGKDAADPFD